MKYIKLFEKIEKDPENVFWIINGDFEYIVKVLRKFLKNKKHRLDNGYVDAEDRIAGRFEDNVKYDDRYNSSNIFGFYLSHREDRYSYWVIDQESDVKEGRENYLMYECKFDGEIKLEDDKIVIDKFLVDVENYNL
jgi:hypothetical protein